MSNLRNVPKLNGRPAGVKNKKTELREKMLEERLLNGDKIFKLIDYIFDQMEEGTLRPSEAIKAFTSFSPFLFRTLADRQVAEVLEGITTREDAEQALNDVKEVITQLRAVK